MTHAAVHTPVSPVIPVVLSELGAGPAQPDARSIETLADVDVDVRVDAGTAVLSFGQLLELSKGDVLALDRTPDTAVDIRVNGTLVARGDVVIVDEEIATRISEIID